MMRKSIKISLKNVQSRQTNGLFNNDPQSDFYLLLQQKLYSLRKQFLSNNSYFAKRIQKNHKVHVIDKNLDRIAFEKILGLFYGIECQLQQEKQIIQVLDVTKFLQLQEVQQLIKHKLWQNFDDYQLFFLLEISYKINDQQLLSRCEEQLISFQFEQLNFVQLTGFQKHNKITSEIEAFRQNQRNQISNFKKKNSTKVDILTALAPPTNAIIVEDSDQEIQDQQVTKFGLRRCATIYESVDRNDFLTSTGFLEMNRQKSFKKSDQISFVKSQSQPLKESAQNKRIITNQDSKSCSIKKRCNPASSNIRTFQKYQHKIMFQKFYSHQLEKTTSPKSQMFEDDLLISDFQKLSLKKSLRYKRKKSQQISTSSLSVEGRISEFSVNSEIQNTNIKANQQNKLFKSQNYKRKK